MNAVPSTVDLSNCDREPIHQLGGIQSTGFLVAISSDWIVRHVSANISEWIGRQGPELIGSPLDSVFSEEAIHSLRNRMQGMRGGDTVERAFNVPLFSDSRNFDVAIHVAGDLIVFEAEDSLAESQLSAASLVQSMLSRLNQSDSFLGFCREGARQVRMLTGFDRVMVYRFGPDGSGQVIAESVGGGLDSFLGLHYPASDIPQQARVLYTRTWMRIISDVNATAVPIIPAEVASGEPLDLSLSLLRSVSPIHLEYLRNMGVAASLSISIMRGGRLWGLLACHHTQPRKLSFERRTAAELFGQMFSLLLESREREDEAADEARARIVQNSLMSAIASDGSSLSTLANFSSELRTLFRCNGVAIWLNGELQTEGVTPTREELTGLVRFLNRVNEGKVYVTAKLGAELPGAVDYVERAAGLLAVPVSRSARDYLLFFRQEVSRTVTWAGNPAKPAELGPNGLRLTPRKSFDAWQEVIHGESEPWSSVDQRIAESLRLTLLEVVLRLTDMAERQRKDSHERHELLIAELNHRVRNILGLVKGLIAQTSSSGSVEDFAEVIGGRIQALARAHDQITTQDWQPASLMAMIRAEGEAYLAGKSDRVRIGGDDVLILPQAFSSVALVIHELVTNSAKYGALCDRSGWVEINLGRDAVNRLTIDWREYGGPPVQPPTRRGFGTTIIERTIPFDLRGEARIEYARDGLHAWFAIPEHLVERAPPPVLLPASTNSPSAAVPLPAVKGQLLLVEDSMIIAMDAEDALRDLGVQQVAVVGSVDEALRYLDRVKPTAALLDYHVGDETSVAVAERLNVLKIPFFFATGYGETLNLPPKLAGCTVIKKPYSKEALKTGLLSILPP